MTTAALRVVDAQTKRAAAKTPAAAAKPPRTNGLSLSATRGSVYNQPHLYAGAQRRPRLFGGSLAEYCQASGEPIPLIITSCIK